MDAVVAEHGWTLDQVRQHLRFAIVGAKSPTFLVNALGKDLPAFPPDVEAGLKEARTRTRWCGTCDERTRQVELDDGRPARCPQCHPRRGVAS
ncbi:hypothetical protein [Lentzea flava]|uniref:hypothetical protein n=1 Tax=Lentzea flava TaxID=103732 RepID=UPI0016703D21|nr:hypothetical protein [Lentzea flava]